MHLLDSSSDSHLRSLIYAYAAKKKNSGIVEMLRQQPNMKTKEKMEVLFKASKELGPDPSQPIDKE
jgi:hypothetical protein